MKMKKLFSEWGEGADVGWNFFMVYLHIHEKGPSGTCW